MCLKGRGSEEARKVGRSPIVKSVVCPLGSSLGPICSERWLAGGTKAGIVQRPTQEGQSEVVATAREMRVGGRNILPRALPALHDKQPVGGKAV